MRHDKRENSQMRDVNICPGFIKNADGSVLISFGNTQVIATASLIDNVPPFAEEKEIGWLTAEYNMLPASTGGRKKRNRMKVDGRTVEIQRFIGRALRGGIDLKRLQGYTLFIDCDVINADGGTRTASITGAFVAAGLAFKKFIKEEKLEKNPIKEYVSAISVGIVDNEIMADLDYPEDSNAYCDMNVVATESGDIIDIQASGEGGSFKKESFDKLLELALEKNKELNKIQKEILK